MAALDTISALGASDRYRLQLLELSVSMGICDKSTIRNALEQDNRDIAMLLGEVLMSKTQRKLISSLKGEHALNFLNLIQHVLDRGLFRSEPALAENAHRLLVKLSEAADILPSSLLIQGVTLSELQPISRGGFAEIFRASYQGKDVALKRLTVRLDQHTETIRRVFRREALVWRHLKHPNVLPFIGIDAETFPQLCMVSPWMTEGTICDFRRLNGPSVINMKERLLEVAQGLEYLHSKGVVHGDLRGANILIDEHWHARLADFGLTIFSEATAGTHSSNNHGCVRWMAPELLLPEDFGLEHFKKTRASDVYAHACVCLEIYTGQHPFLDIPNDAAVVFRVMQRQRPTRPTGDQEGTAAISDALWDLLERCWTHWPSGRPDMVEALRSWERSGITLEHSRVMETGLEGGDNGLRSAIPDIGPRDLYDEGNLARRPEDWRADYMSHSDLSSLMPRRGESLSGVLEINDQILRVMHPLLTYHDSQPPVDLDLRNPPTPEFLQFPSLGRPFNDHDLAQISTNPPCHQLRLSHPRLPWYIDINATHPNGITIRDILTQQYNVLMQPIRSNHFWNEGLSVQDRAKLTGYFQDRCGGNMDEIGKGVRKVDFLGRKLIFEGFARKPSGVWEIRTAKISPRPSSQ